MIFKLYMIIFQLFKLPMAMESVVSAECYLFILGFAAFPCLSLLFLLHDFEMI